MVRGSEREWEGVHPTALQAWLSPWSPLSPPLSLSMIQIYTRANFICISIPWNQNQTKQSNTRQPTHQNKQTSKTQETMPTNVSMVDGAAGPTMKNSDVTHSQLFSGTSCLLLCCPGLTQCFYKGLLAHPWEIFLCCALIEKLHGKYPKLSDQTSCSFLKNSFYHVYLLHIRVYGHMCMPWP